MNKVQKTINKEFLIQRLLNDKLKSNLELTKEYCLKLNISFKESVMKIILREILKNRFVLQGKSNKNVLAIAIYLYSLLYIKQVENKRIFKFDILNSLKIGNNTVNKIEKEIYPIILNLEFIEEINEVIKDE